MAELEKSWIHVSSHLGDRCVVIDLTNLTFADAAGKYLLALLRKQGAHLSGSGATANDLIAETAGFSQSSRRKKHTTGKRSGGLLSVLLIFFFSFATNSQCADARAAMSLTLQQAVRIALEQSPQVLIANLKIAQAQENSHIQRANLLPQISLKSSDALIRENLATNLGLYLPILPHHLGPFYDIQAGPEFSMPVFDLTLWKRWKASKEDVASSRSQLVQQREEIALLVVSQYLGALRNYADVKAANSRVELAKALYHLAKDMQTNGVGTSIDMLRANVQFQNEQQRLIAAQTELQTSLYGLVKLLNLDSQQPYPTSPADPGSKQVTPRLS